MASVSVGQFYFRLNFDVRFYVIIAELIKLGKVLDYEGQQLRV